MDRTERFYRIQKLLTDRKLVTTEQFYDRLVIFEFGKSVRFDPFTVSQKLRGAYSIAWTVAK